MNETDARLKFPILQPNESSAGPGLFQYELISAEMWFTQAGLLFETLAE